MRDQILNEIRRLAKANGGQPPGFRLFERETGIPRSAWRGKYWGKWSDAVEEAGLNANIPRETIPEETFLAQLASLFKKLGKVPTVMEMKIRARNERDCPNPRSILSKFGSNDKMLERLKQWVAGKKEFADVELLLAERVVSDAPSVSIR